MQPVKIMITNGGPHSAEKWAELTASEIVTIGSEAAPDSPARKFELKVIGILEDHHAHVQAAERAQLDVDGDGRLESPLDGQEHDTESVLADILAAAAETGFAEHFGRQDVRDRLRFVLQRHTVLNQDVERGWYADQNPSEATAAWRKVHDEQGLLHAHNFAAQPDAGAATAAKEA